jgi:ribose transport system substrate-binding protein
MIGAPRHRSSLVVLGAALLATALAATPVLPSTLAQEATPAATPVTVAAAREGLPESCSAERPLLGVALPNTVNPYYVAMQQSFLDNGTAAGFDVNVAIANDSDPNQLAQIDAFIQQGVCAVALNAVNSGPGAASVAALNRAGIPVFTVNVIVSPEDLERQQAEIIQYVGADQVQGGQVMGEAVIEDYGTDAEIVFGIVGNPDQIPTNQRDQGFRDALAVNPNVREAALVNGKVDPQVSLRVTTEMLQGNPDINVIFADTGPHAVGAIQAIRQLNRSGEVALYGFCAAETALDDTLYRGCAAQEPAEYARIVVDQAARYLNGEDVPVELLSPLKVFSEGQTPAPGEVG